MRFIAIVMALFIGLASPAWADATKDLDDAQRFVDSALSAESKEQITDNLDTAAEFYSRAIESGELSRDDLIRAYLDRGSIYEIMHLYDRVIADYQKVLKIDPGNEHATEWLQSVAACSPVPDPD